MTLFSILTTDNYSFGETMRSFWHAVTSYDRHASHDTPFRLNRASTISSGRNAPLTSISAGMESTQDLDPLYGSNDFGRSTLTLSTGSPHPGKLPDNNIIQSPNDVQLQSFSDGLPPAPPVSHSWKRIDRWAEEHYEELFDQLSEPATLNDLNELELDLDCSLPQDVRESITIHDGQERGGTPTGIIFGSMLLDCEEILQEWKQWKEVNDQYMLSATQEVPKAFGSTTLQPVNPQWRNELLSKQDCVPANAVQKAYAHPGWIPLVRDWGGNNIAIDLAPGPQGKWGQVILFGRDYDIKYVVARSWSAFMAMVADDLGSGKWFVEEESGALKLREFKAGRVEPEYFDILRWRTDMKHGGPRRPRRRPGNPNGGGSGSGSPTLEPSGKSSVPRLGRNQSPSSQGFGSPLARVTEEAPRAVGASSEASTSSATPTEHIPPLTSHLDQ
jgi:cell wall assembly regulator SMI1